MVVSIKDYGFEAPGVILLPWTPNVRFVSQKFIFFKKGGTVTMRRETSLPKTFHSTLELNPILSLHSGPDSRKSTSSSVIFSVH